MYGVVQLTFGALLIGVIALMLYEIAQSTFVGFMSHTRLAYGSFNHFS